MEFGVFLPVSGRASTRTGLIRAAQQAEALGFTTVWAADRIVIPWKVETPYNYSWTGSFFVPPQAPFLEPLTVLAFLAGATETVKLGVSVLVAPYRDPVYWAKVVASIAYLSTGRFVLGVGVGWMYEEFVALGKAEAFSERGRVTDEQLEVFRTLLTDEHCSHHGRHYQFDDIAFHPKGHDDRGRIPLWIGGEAPPAQRRAGRVADAWFPYFPRVTPAELAARYAVVRDTAATCERDPDSVSLNCCLSVEITDGAIAQEPDVLRGSTAQVAERLQQFREIGVEHCGLQFLVGRYPERLEQMQRFSEDVIQPGVLS